MQGRFFCSPAQQASREDAACKLCHAMIAAFGVGALPSVRRVFRMCKDTHSTSSESSDEKKPARRSRTSASARLHLPVLDTVAATPREVRVAQLKAQRAERMKKMWKDPSFRERMANARKSVTEGERSARSERLRAKWNDPAWRERLLKNRESPETVRKMSESAKLKWTDPAFREKMRAARLGRPAPNKGVSPSDITRLRMSIARRGVKKSEDTRRRMSEAKLNRPDGATWPQLISESKLGKTKEYFQMRREFRALHRDLKLWSDTYHAKYGKLPDASTCELFVAPMMVFRIRRYLTLRESFGGDDRKEFSSKIIATK